MFISCLCWGCVVCQSIWQCFWLGWVTVHHNCWYTVCAPHLPFLFLVHPSIIAYMSIMFDVGARLSWTFMLLGSGCGWWFGGVGSCLGWGGNSMLAWYKSLFDCVGEVFVLCLILYGIWLLNGLGLGFDGSVVMLYWCNLLGIFLFGFLLRDGVVCSLCCWATWLQDVFVVVGEKFLLCLYGFQIVFQVGIGSWLMEVRCILGAGWV